MNNEWGMMGCVWELGMECQSSRPLISTVVLWVTILAIFASVMTIVLGSVNYTLPEASNQAPHHTFDFGNGI